MTAQATTKTGPPVPAPKGWRIGLSWLTGLLVLGAVVVVALHFTELKRFATLAQRRSRSGCWPLSHCRWSPISPPRGSIG